jgi:hemerythrin-like domain-containing protein
MRRDPRLRRLSSEHHQALVLARSLTDHGPGWTVADGAALARRFAAELEPHFRAEEELVLPAIRAAEPELADRTEADHAFLRAAVAAAARGDGDAARALGERLVDHVRFEERILFPAAERLLTADQLDEVARRYPDGA